MEVDTLKIDRSLLSKNCETDKERILLESIFNFAHRLRLTTVAEGVETKKCSICKATITDVSGNAVTQTIARIPHIWTVKETEEDGKIWITYVCSVCGAEKVDENGVVIKVEKPALATYTVTFKVEGEEAAPKIVKVKGKHIIKLEK